MSNPTGKGGWQKGQSGNPNGRPLKGRALTEILKRAGSKTTEDIDGKKRSGKRIMARALWDIAATGRTLLPGKNGNSDLSISVDGDAWFAVVKWIFQQIDGPVKSAVDVTTKGESFNDGPRIKAEQHAKSMASFANVLRRILDSEDAQGNSAMDTSE